MKIYDQVYNHMHLIALKMKAIRLARVSVAAINYWVFPWIALIDVKLASTPWALSPLSGYYVAEIKKMRVNSFERFHTPKNTLADSEEEMIKLLSMINFSSSPLITDSLRS